MIKPSFFELGRSLTLREIADLTGAKPFRARLDARISNVATLDRAGPFDLAYLEAPKYLSDLQKTAAAACLVPERFAEHVPQNAGLLVTPSPYRAFLSVARALFPGAARPSSLFGVSPGEATGASIHPTARFENEVTVDPGAVIGPGAEIGSGTTIGANAVVGPEVRIGRDCVIGAGASIQHALIGDRVTVHPGCRIGQDGFGYAPGAGGHAKIPQLGRVIIQDDVEIGANTTIERGGLNDTVVGEGTKIDNLVQ
ncbi:MAG: UDP-3-O-(3-hydroxymyristoyl)glucosamine N-acyltransferase, partial [Microbacteriaceae bacterium]|nr:UDP-3-O-(3-hydroxymyristoyl)glucosamine N-acyltransferase [Microbacteriaceae bacterium]